MIHSCASLATLPCEAEAQTNRALCCLGLPRSQQHQPVPFFLQPKADAAAAVPSTTELFVKNLPPTFVDDDLEKVFAVFGPLKHSYGAHLPPRFQLTHSARRLLQRASVRLTHWLDRPVWSTVQLVGICGQHSHVCRQCRSWCKTALRWSCGAIALAAAA